MEGLYARLYIGTVCPPTAADLIAQLRGIEWTSRQTKRRWYIMGSLNTVEVLRGIIEHDGRARHALVNLDWLGTLNIGTWQYCGSLVPRGPTTPAVLGTVEITDLTWSEMAAENEMAVIEDIGFIMYNLTFVP